MATRFTGLKKVFISKWYHQSDCRWSNEPLSRLLGPGQETGAVSNIQAKSSFGELRATFHCSGYGELSNPASHFGKPCGQQSPEQVIGAWHPGSPPKAQHEHKSVTPSHQPSGTVSLSLCTSDLSATARRLSLGDSGGGSMLPVTMAQP